MGDMLAPPRPLLTCSRLEFFWPSLFKDVYAYVRPCDCCQRMGNLLKKNEMPLNFILEVEIFDVYNINFMGPFYSPRGNKYILIAVDYVSKSG